MDWNNRFRGLAVALSMLMTGCVHRVAVETFALPEDALRIGETDITEFIRAADSLRFAGTATLREGRFRLDAGDYASIEIPADTTLTFEANVDLRFPEEDGDVRIQPQVRTFAVQFSNAIVLVGTPESPRRVTLEGARLDEADPTQVSVDIRMGRTVVQSLASVVAGVPASQGDLPEAMDMFARVEVGEVRLGLRPDAVIHHAGSELHLAPGSALSMQRVDVDFSARSARLDLDANLELGAGTCIRVEGGRLCVEGGRFDLRGTYSRRVEGRVDVGRLNLTSVDRPSRLTLGSGRFELDGDGGGFAMSRAELALHRYECGGPVGQPSECVRGMRGDMDMSEGDLMLGEHRVRFDSLHIERAMLGAAGLEDEPPAEEAEAAPADGTASELDSTPSGSATANASGDAAPNTEHVAPEGAEEDAESSEAPATEYAVALREMQFRGVELESGTATMAFEGLTIRDVQGQSWSSLSAGTGEIIAQEGRLSVQLGGATIEGALQGESRIRLQQARSGFEVEATLQNVALRAGPHTVSAPSLVVALVSGESDSLSLRAPGDVQVQSAGELAIDDLRLQFRALHMTRADGELRFRTEGLRLSLPEQEVLRVLEPELPPAIFGEEQELDAATQAVLARVSDVVMSRELSRFRTRLDARGFSGWNLRFDRGRIRATGDLHLNLVVLADEREVELEVCHHNVRETVQLPCFEDGLPGFCDQVVEANVPYPCLQENQSLAEVFSGAVGVDLDVTGEVSSNAPANLSELELTARVSRCDRIRVVGIPAALQRAADVRGALCDRLREESQTVSLAEVAPMVAGSPMLAGARVETFRFDSDGERLNLDLDLDIRLPDPEAPAEQPAAN